MKLQESGENYLETILVLQNRKGYVRAIDIANELNYSKPSVSRAMGILKKAGYILTDQDGRIVLTKEGNKRANEIYERHQLITKYLMMTLDIDETTASADACRIEHILSQTSFAKVQEVTKRIAALRESDSNYSMANQFLTSPASIEVSNGDIYATIVMRGTEQMPISSLQSLQYSYNNVDFMDADLLFNHDDDTLTITLPILDLNNPVYMKAYAPGTMGPIHPRFRLVFKIDTVVEK